MKSLRIVFMGTPEFAVATLGSLLINGFNVVGVVTAPDRPSGRGRKINKSSVKEFAEFSNLPILQPVNLKDPKFLTELRNLSADIFLVVAFRMLPEEVWKMPPMGTINLHASLLPDYRGAAPINHAIINGETVTGITTFFIDEKIDTGQILLREEIHIFPFENAGDLHDRLMKHGARLIIRTLSAIVENKVTPIPQTQLTKKSGPVKLAPKIHPDDCIINWDRDPVQIHNFIRGLSPYPGAKSTLIKDSLTHSIKIFDCQPESSSHSYKPGHIISDSKHFIRVACNAGFINISNLQLEGKKKMNTVEFLRGFRIEDYTMAVT